LIKLIGFLQVRNYKDVDKEEGDEEEEEEDDDDEAEKEKEAIEYSSQPPPIQLFTNDIDDAPSPLDRIDDVSQDPLNLEGLSVVDRLREGDAEDAEEPEERDEVDGQTILSFKCAEELEDFLARQNSASARGVQLSRTSNIRPAKGISSKSIWALSSSLA